MRNPFVWLYDVLFAPRVVITNGPDAGQVRRMLRPWPGDKGYSYKTARWRVHKPWDAVSERSGPAWGAMIDDGPGTKLVDGFKEWLKS